MALFIPNWVEPTRSCGSAETAASVAVRTGYVSRSTGRMRFAIAGSRLTEPRQHYPQVPKKIETIDPLVEQPHIWASCMIFFFNALTATFYYIYIHSTSDIFPSNSRCTYFLSKLIFCLTCPLSILSLRNRATFLPPLSFTIPLSPFCLV